MNKAILSLLLLSFFSTAKSQNAILENEEDKVEISSNGEAFTYTCSKSIKLLNSKAEDYGNFVLQMSKKNETLNRFSAVISDANGKIIRKIKEKELQKTEYSPELASDAYTLYLDITPPTYPVTITYNYQISTKNTFVAFPPFMPQDDYDMSVKKATYTIISPENYKWNHKVVNADIKPQTTTINGKSTSVFSIENLPAVSNEHYSKGLKYRTPLIYFIPDKFNYFSTQGSFSSWEEMGRWHYSLTKNRDWLPEEAINKIKVLTANCKTDKEKIAILYKLLRDNTRYVSIQLGIGGYQPMMASDTWKYAFGDCKALSNLMKAMLNVVDIKSNLIAIGTNSKHLYRSLPNTIQMNHMILEVPLKGDTCWLECTNPELPLGYVHDGISGHDAIELSEGGGKIVTLPEYADSINLNVTTVVDSLHADGSAHIKIIDDYQGHLYEGAYGITKKTLEEQKKSLISMYRLPQPENATISLEDKREPFTIPRFITTLSVTSKQYANLTGSRLFVPSNPIHKSGSYSKAEENRKSNIHIEQGHKTVENITLIIPEGFIIEGIPSNISEKHSFGNFSSTCKADGNKIYICNVVHMVHGEYDKSIAKELNLFLDHVRNYLNSRIVLKKQ